MRSQLGSYFIIALLLSSCGYYSEHSDPGADVDLAKSSLEFQSVQAAIFTPHCVRCHQSYASYNGVRRELAAINSAVAANRMPKSAPPLSENLKQLLQSWISAGAPERAGEPAPEPAPVVLEANWKSISENILAPKCLVCHNPDGQAKFLDLSSRQAIFSARSKLLDFDNPEASYLLAVVQDPDEPMPPPSSNIPRLNSREIEVLTEWIALGLP